MLSSQYAEVWRSDSGVVSLHRSHYLKSSALKQKVRDQQILTSGQAYDSILMQFSLSNSLIITLLPANLISHLSKFRHIHSASIFTKLWHWQSIPQAAFPKQFIAGFSFFTVGMHSLTHSERGEMVLPPPKIFEIISLTPQKKYSILCSWLCCVCNYFPLWT